ncbi:MAG: right-handed parallel beta-helix repeat-containing protein [Myxococcales bacterium]|nr:right-handed parallel beta-helix repeat-containing protein [Myxococcales bacterium]
MDCDDTDPQVHPDAPERCNGIDDDCDPVTVEDGVVSVDGQGSFGTIADALVAAAPGSEVRVCPGTYLESLTIDMDLALVSEQGPSSTIVDAMGLGPTVTVTGGEVRIAGLTLTGGSSLGLGGGLSITGTDPVTVQDCVITGNTSSDGAGIYGYVGAQLELVQTTIENNVGGIGGGVAFNGDGLTGSLTLTECTVQGNDADETGGGLFVADVPVVELTATSVVGNTSLDGGGLRVIASPVTLVDSTVQGNTATGTGGGLGLFPGALGVITSIDTDWGTGATDNAPDDVFVTGAGSWAGYGAGASFTCDGTGCS